MTQNKITHNNTFKFLLLVLILLIFLLMGKFFSFDLVYYKQFLSKFPVAISAIIFIFIYVVLTTLIWFGPKDILRVVSAVLFGGVVSTIFISIAELCNAFILFKLSRKLGRDFIVQKFKLKQKDIDKMEDNSSVLGVMALRINPLIPLRFQDLGTGLSSVNIINYLIGIAIISPLRIFWQQYVLADIGENLDKFFYVKIDIATLMKDPSTAWDVLNNHPMIQYYMANPFIIKYSFVYAILFLFLSMIALVVKCSKKKSPKLN